MKPERWAQIDQLLQSALEHPPEQRATFLENECGNDKDLKREVESLLAHHQRAGRFLEDPPSELAAQMLDQGGQARLAVGQMLDHYKTLALLGAGGMGEVYLASDTRLGRRVALKLLPERFTQNEGRGNRFKLEARAISALNHPNIVTIHEIGCVETTHYIVTEFIEGQTLRQRLMQSSMKRTEALDVAIQLASAVDAAHSAGIVHRDIKPENIMLRPDGLIKVLDFGLAKLVEPKESTPEFDRSTGAEKRTDIGVIIGTAQYMSPEQARGQEIDSRTDIWSVGVVMYEMLSGVAPFDGETPSHAIVAVLEKDPQSLAKFSVDVPAEFERIVRCALQKNRDERYQTAGKLLVELKRLQQAGRVGVPMENSMDEKLAATVIGSRNSNGQRIVTRRRVLGGLAALGATGASYLLFAGSNHLRNSVLVMSFDHAADDPDSQQLSRSISEDITNTFSRLPQLRVIPGPSEPKAEIRALGHQVNVMAVLTGEVTQSGGVITISVKLLDAGDGSQIWFYKDTKPIERLIEMKDQIITEVSEALLLRLTDKDRKILASGSPENAEAFQLYSKGRYFWRGATDKEQIASGEYFLQATKKDPNYALAWAGVADFRGLMAAFGRAPSLEAWHQSEEAAIMALTKDSTLGEVHFSMGAAKMWLRWNWHDAEKHFEQTISLAPGFPEGYGLYTRLLGVTGRFSEAMDMARRATEADPLTIRARRGWPLALIYYYAGRYQDSINEWLKVAGHPTMDKRIGLGNAYVKLRRFDEAIAGMPVAEEQVVRTRQLARIGYIYAAAYRTKEANGILDKVKADAKKTYNLAYSIAAIYAGLENKKEAMSWLLKSFEEHENSIIDVSVDPRFHLLRTEPEFRKLLAKMNLTP